VITDAGSDAPTFVELNDKGVVQVEWNTGHYFPFIRHTAPMTTARLDGDRVILTADDGEQWRCRAGGAPDQVREAIADLVACYGVG
jgi:hypothetical protein